MWNDLVGLMAMTIWMAALYLLLANAKDATTIISGFGKTWFDGIKVLQARA